MAFYLFRYGAAETFAIHGQSFPARNFVFHGGGDDDGTEAKHFGLELARRRSWRFGFKRIRTDEFGEPGRRMRRCHVVRTHFVEANSYAAACRRPRRFHSGESCSDDDDHWL